MIGRGTADRRGRTYAALLSVLLVAGCAGLPTDTAVKPGLGVNRATPPAVGLEYFPDGPDRGASPEGIIRGFIRAGAASDGDYQVARRFLTAGPARTWTPDGDILVFRGDTPMTVTPAGPNAWTVQSGTVGRITPAGQYVPAPEPSWARVTFGLTKVGTEWRISSLPSGFGRWVEAGDVARLFRVLSVYYPSVADGSMVPDPRWFPADHLAARLAQAQIGPVPDYLKGAVSTGFPPDVRLRVGAVPVANDVATVDLAATFPNDVSTRRTMWAQLATSLTQITDVAAVTVEGDGSVLDYPGRPAVALSPGDLGVDSQPATDGLPVMRVGSTLVQVDPTQVTGSPADPSRRRRVTLPAVDPQWRWLAVSRDSTEVAAVDARDAVVARFRGGTHASVPTTATSPSRPAYDNRGFLWFGGIDGPADRLFAVDASQPPDRAAPAEPVLAPWLRERYVVAARLAGDGQRIAVVSTDARGVARLDVAGVVRSRSGRPTSLAAPKTLGATISGIRDVTWLDSTTLAVLGRDAAKTLRPFTVGIDGAVEALAPVDGAAAIATSGDEQTIVVTTTGDLLWVRAGTGWLRFRTATDFALPAG